LYFGKVLSGTRYNAEEEEEEEEEGGGEEGGERTYSRRVSYGRRVADVAILV